MELRVFTFAACLLITLAVTRATPVGGDGEASRGDTCPEDSVLVNGTCECDETRCDPPPPCNQELTLHRNATGTPGSCCAKYTCGLCTPESIAAGTCMCAVGAILSPDGECLCTDLEMELIDGVCICDDKKCLPQEECDDQSLTLKEFSECCRTNICIKCPDDSYPRRTTQDPATFDENEVEDKCVCYPCEEKKCANGTVNIIQWGNSLPGHCCDVYECRTVCIVEGIPYAHDDLIYANGTTSICKHGVIIHQESDEKHVPICTYGDGIYENGTEWKADECTKCKCVDGKSVCFAEFCQPNGSEHVTIKSTCTLPTHCVDTCDAGYKIVDGCPICECNNAEPNVDLSDQISNWFDNLSSNTDVWKYSWLVLLTLLVIMSAVLILYIIYKTLKKQPLICHMSKEVDKCDKSSINLLCEH